MKKSLIAIAVGAVIAPMANANIVISEVVEGSSNNKAIEVANVGSSSVQLSGYSLFIESNGSGNWSNEYDLSEVTLGSGETHVVTHAQAADDLLAKGDATGTITYFNGDDSISLQKDGNIVDILGYVDDTDYNKDVTLKRIDMTPSTSYDPAKFEVLEKDSWEDIGKVELAGGGAGEVVITEYVEGSSNNKAIELYNNGSEDIDLTGYKLVRYKDGDETPLDMVILDGQTLPAKSVLVVLHDSATITLDDEIGRAHV